MFKELLNYPFYFVLSIVSKAEDTQGDFIRRSQRILSPANRGAFNRSSSDILDIDDFIRQSLRSAKFAIAVGDTLNEFRQSLRSAYKIVLCAPGLRGRLLLFKVAIFMLLIGPKARKSDCESDSRCPITAFCYPTLR